MIFEKAYLSYLESELAHEFSSLGLNLKFAEDALDIIQKENEFCENDVYCIELLGKSDRTNVGKIIKLNYPIVLTFACEISHKSDVKTILSAFVSKITRLNYSEQISCDEATSVDGSNNSGKIFLIQNLSSPVAQTGEQIINANRVVFIDVSGSVVIQNVPLKVYVPNVYELNFEYDNQTIVGVIDNILSEQWHSAPNIEKQQVDGEEYRVYYNGKTETLILEVYYDYEKTLHKILALNNEKNSLIGRLTVKRPRFDGGMEIKSELVAFEVSLPQNLNTNPVMTLTFVFLGDIRND